MNEGPPPPYKKAPPPSKKPPPPSDRFSKPPPLRASPSPSAKPTQATYQIWVKTPAGVGTNPGNVQISTASVTAVLCPAVYGVIRDALLLQGVYAAQAFINTSATGTMSTLGGCSSVSPLPSAFAPTHYASKYLLALSTVQWNKLYTALMARSTVTRGHMMCGSTMFFDIYPNPASNPLALSPWTAPQWLNASATATCSTDVYGPIKA